MDNYNFVEIGTVVDYGKEDIPCPYRPKVKVSHYNKETMVLELNDATTDPLKCIKEYCVDIGVYNVQTSCSIMQYIVTHPLVEDMWESYRFTWKKRDGRWMKTVYSFAEDSVVNFNGVDWFL